MVGCDVALISLLVGRMQQVEELSSSTAAMMSDGFLFKSEMIEQPTPSAVYVNDSAGAPPPVLQAQMVVQPIVSSEPTFKGPSKTPPKRVGLVRFLQ